MSGEERLHGGDPQGDGHRPPPQGIRPHPDRILTVCGTAAFAGISAHGRGRGPDARRRGPRHRPRALRRVLVATLDDDINPVSQHYLQAPGAAGRARRLRRARRRARHAGRARHLDARRSSRASSPRPCRSIVYVSPCGLERRLRRRRDRRRPPTCSRWRRRRTSARRRRSRRTAPDFSKDLRRKIVNDAAAYIAELAREHGRNAAAAEAMVREAANFGAREAAAKNIVDVVSPTLPAPAGRDRRHA